MTDGAHSYKFKLSEACKNLDYYRLIISNLNLVMTEDTGNIGKKESYLMLD